MQNKESVETEGGVKDEIMLVELEASKPVSYDTSIEQATGSIFDSSDLEDLQGSSAVCSKSADLTQPAVGEALMRWKVFHISSQLSHSRPCLDVVTTCFAASSITGCCTELEAITKDSEGAGDQCSLSSLSTEVLEEKSLGPTLLSVEPVIDALVAQSTAAAAPVTPKVGSPPFGSSQHRIWQQNPVELSLIAISGQVLQCVVRWRR